MAKNIKLSISTREELKQTVEELFLAEDGIEIPDDAVVGHFKTKFAMLEARVSALTNLVETLSAKQTKAPAPKAADKVQEKDEPAGRVDAVALAEKAKGSKKK